MTEKIRARHTKTAGKTTWGGGDTRQGTSGLLSDAKLTRQIWISTNKVPDQPERAERNLVQATGTRVSFNTAPWSRRAVITPGND